MSCALASASFTIFARVLAAAGRGREGKGMEEYVKRGGGNEGKKEEEENGGTITASKT